MMCRVLNIDLESCLRKLFRSNLNELLAIFVFVMGWEILKLILGGPHYKLVIHRGFLAPTEPMLVCAQ